MEAGGGTRRPAPEGAATRPPPCSRPGGSDPRPSWCRAAQRPAAEICATAPGGGAGEGHRALARGVSDSTGFSEVSPKANRAGWAARLGKGSKRLPTLWLLKRRRAGHLLESVPGFSLGRTRVVCLLDPDSVSFLQLPLTPAIRPERASPARKTTPPPTPNLLRHCASSFSRSRRRDPLSDPLVLIRVKQPSTPVALSLPSGNDSF